MWIIWRNRSGKLVSNWTWVNTKFWTRWTGLARKRGRFIWGYPGWIFPTEAKTWTSGRSSNRSSVDRTPRARLWWKPSRGTRNVSRRGASYASTARKLHQDRGRIHPVSAHARVSFYGTLLEATTCFAKLVRRIGVSSTIYEDLLESSDVGAAFRRRIRSDHIIWIRLRNV